MGLTLTMDELREARNLAGELQLRPTQDIWLDRDRRGTLTLMPDDSGFIIPVMLGASRDSRVREYLEQSARILGAHRVTVVGLDTQPYRVVKAHVRGQQFQAVVQDRRTRAIVFCPKAFGWTKAARAECDAWIAAQ